MKAQKFLVVLLALLLAGVGGAWARGGHVHGHVGVYFGPVWGPWWYPPPYYSQPQVIVVPPPPVYIEQQDTSADPAAAGQQYWYYCKSAKGYYPYVKECPNGWQKVLPQPEK